MYNKFSSEIKTVVSDYFQGIYNGDSDKLENTFHTQALLFGDIKGEPYFKTAADYIDGVNADYYGGTIKYGEIKCKNSISDNEKIKLNLNWERITKGSEKVNSEYIKIK